MNMNKQQMVDIFFTDLFPNGKVLLEAEAFSLMGQYLKLIDQELTKQKITRQELANRIGISSSYLSQLFNFNKLINLKVLSKIQSALGIKFTVNLKNNIEHFDKKNTDVYFNIDQSELRVA